MGSSQVPLQGDLDEVGQRPAVPLGFHPCCREQISLQTKGKRDPHRHILARSLRSSVLLGGCYVKRFVRASLSAFLDMAPTAREGVRHHLVHVSLRSAGG
jgi:hypothetical protein